MTPSSGSNRRYSFAQVLSDVFSPLLVPTYGMIMAMWLTPLRDLPERNRLTATVLIAAITGLLPALSLMGLKGMGRLSDYSAVRLEERRTPLLIAVICYVAAALMLMQLHAPSWLAIFFFAAAAAALITGIVTAVYRWKISAHSVAIGGLNGLITWLALGEVDGIGAMILLSAGIVVAGSVASARLVLGRHTLSQTLAGLALGFACTFIPTIISNPL